MKKTAINLTAAALLAVSYSTEPIACCTLAEKFVCTLASTGNGKVVIA